jgi:RNA polymerase sigma-70 factor, ECF subfamily
MRYVRDPLANPEVLIRRVYAYVAYRIGDGPEAEDVTSEVFERAVRYRDGYDHNKGEPLAWLIGIARRCIAQGMRESHASLPEAWAATAPGDVEADSLRRLELVEALSSLAERDRELIALRYGADLTARQIGELLGSGTNAIEVALHRALGRLRTVLDQYTEEEPRSRAVEA